ncbi:hypothetical protein LPJ55_004344, partial [Coemansia sp. RSA 990]
RHRRLQEHEQPDRPERQLRLQRHDRAARADEPARRRLRRLRQRQRRHHVQHDGEGHRLGGGPQALQPDRVQARPGVPAAQLARALRGRVRRDAPARGRRAPDGVDADCGPADVPQAVHEERARGDEERHLPGGHCAELRHALVRRHQGAGHLDHVVYWRQKPRAGHCVHRGGRAVRAAGLHLCHAPLLPPAAAGRPHVPVVEPAGGVGPGRRRRRRRRRARSGGGSSVHVAQPCGGGRAAPL